MTSIAAPIGHRRVTVVSVLGATQIFAWGSSYYLLAVLANPIADATGWPLAWIMCGLSLGLFTSGLIAPRVGRTIEQRGGRSVLAVSAILLAAGLFGLSLSSHFAAYLLSWIVIGLGMGCGLYDAAFATLGRLYGTDARGAITALTLWGGFASTVCWPLTAYLIGALGWQGACLVYGTLHLTLALPLYVFGLPKETASPMQPAQGMSARADMVEQPGIKPDGRRSLLLTVIAASFTMSAVIGSVISAHLLIILQARDMTLAAAVALGALMGPSQVGARVVELAIGRHCHPIGTMIAASVLMLSGLTVLVAGLPAVALGLILYGSGIGIMSIVRGTLPLAVFGAQGFATLVGRLAMPSLIAQSLSPIAAAFMLDRFGAGAVLYSLAGLGGACLLSAGTLWLCLRFEQVNH